MKLQDFIKKYRGKQVEYHSYGNTAYYQCTDLCNQYMTEVWNVKPIIGTNACDFSTKFNKDELTFTANTPKGVPTEGDVVIWNNKVGGGAGHVAVYIEGNDKRFTSFDQNWNKATCEVTEHNYNNVSGWLSTIKAPEPIALKPSSKLPDEFYKINEAKELISRKKLTDKDAFDTVLTTLIKTDDARIKAESALVEAETQYEKDLKEKVKNAEIAVEESYSETLRTKNTYIIQLEARVKELETNSNTTLATAKELINKLKGIFGL